MLFSRHLKQLLHSMIKMTFLLIAALVSFWPCIGECLIVFKDGGYSGIVVAIRDTVPEDEGLIENIKVLFTDFSKLLYDVTEGKAFFEEVTIALPSTWRKKRNYKHIYSDPFSSAHVRIDGGNPQFRDRPYTLQAGGCGEPGLYIHLTPNFINGKVSELEGNLENHLLHEWLHFRYGVFDEYPPPNNPRFPPFYFEDGKMYPTSCMGATEGWISDIAPDKKCHRKLGIGFFNCIFLPNTDDPNFHASVMFIPSGDKICKEFDHNSRAPTPQNLFCKRQSVWTTVMSHADFKTESRNQNSTVPKPNFRFVRRPSEDTKLVLVLDISASMKNNGRMNSLLQLVVRFIKDDVPDGAYVGIAAFGAAAEKVVGLTKVTERSREMMVTEVKKLTPRGSASIAYGLTAGIEVMKNDSDDSIEGGFIILITDNEEDTNSNDVREAINLLVFEKVIANTLAFGGSAFNMLKAISMATGGSNYFANDLKGDVSIDLGDVLFNSIASQSSEDTQPVKIADYTFQVNGSSKQTFKFLIDDDLGKKTVFKIMTKDISNIDAVAVNPDNKKYDRNSPECDKEGGVANRIVFKILNSKNGIWKVQVTNLDKSKPHTVSLTLMSWPRDIREQPIRIKTWLGNFHKQNGIADVKVFAEVKKGFSPVVDATVTAVLKTPIEEQPITLILGDDGTGNDITVDDGIYTGQFRKSASKAIYYVVAHMRNEEGKAKLKNTSSPSFSVRIPGRRRNRTKAGGGRLEPPKSTFDITDVNIVSVNDTSFDPGSEDSDFQPIGTDITRSSTPGVFTFHGLPESADKPNYFLYEILVIKCVGRSVTLKWSNPTNVKRIELRANNTFVKKEWVFENDFLIEDEHVTEGTLEATPGQSQTVTLQMPDFFFPEGKKLVDIHFSVVGFDVDGVQIGRPDTITANFGLYELDQEHINQTKENTSIVLWLSVPAVVVAILVAAIFFFVKVKKGKL